jgi:hypothetical protein
MMQPKPQILPVSLPPRGLSRFESAAYVGVCPNTFDDIVSNGSMPMPKKIKRRNVWDRLQVDRAIEELSVENGSNENEWDVVA